MDATLPELPPTVEEVAAGINTSRSVSTTDLLPSDFQGNLNRGMEFANVETALKPQATTGQLADSIAQTTLTGQIWDSVGASLNPYPADPNFTFERFSGRLKEASKVLPDNMLFWVQDAKSDAEFDALLARAQQRIKAHEDIAASGWGGHTANFLAQLLDPASLAVAVGTGGLLGAATKASQMTRAMQIARNAGIGAGVGVAIEAGKAATGSPVEAPEYLMAAGTGALFMGAFGPISKNPGTQAEAAAITVLGRKMMDEAVKVTETAKARFNPPKPSVEPPSPPPTSTSLPHGIEYIYQTNAAGSSSYVLTKDGKEIGRALTAPEGQGLKIEKIELDPEYQQKGIGSALYDRIEKDTGKKLVPDSILSESAYKLWTRRNADAVKDYVKVGELYEAPKKISKVPFDPHEKGLVVLVRKDPTGTTIREWLANRDLAEIKHIANEQAISGVRDATTAAEAIEAVIVGAKRRVSQRLAAASSPDGFTDSLARGDAKIAAASKGQEVASALESVGLPKEVTKPLGDALDTVLPQAPKVADEVDPLLLATKAPAEAAAKIARNFQHEGPIDRIPRLVDQGGNDSYRVAERLQGLSKDKLVAIAKDTGTPFTPKDSAKKIADSIATRLYHAEYEAVTNELARYTDVGFGAPLKSGGSKSEAAQASMAAEGAKARAVFEEAFQRHDPRPVAGEPVSPPAPADAGAAAAPPQPTRGMPFLEDPDWNAVFPDGRAPGHDIPRPAFSLWRFDRAGRVGRNENAAGRLIGNHLINDTVGKADHSVTAFTADLDMQQTLSKYMTSFNTARGPALEEWLAAEGVNPAMSLVRANDFYNQVGLVIRNPALADQYHPSVSRFADHVRQINKEILADFQNPGRHKGQTSRPVIGAEDVPENENYLWRQWSHENLRGALAPEAFGEAGVTRTIRGAIQAAQPGIDEAVLDRLARGFVRSLARRGAGIMDDWSAAISHGDWHVLRRHLIDDAGLTEAEATMALDRIRPSRGGSGSDMTNLKRRVLLDESHVERGLPHGTNGTADLAITDLLENNVEALFGHYARRAAGRVAMARMQIKLPVREAFKSEYYVDADGVGRMRQVPDGVTGGDIIQDGVVSHDEFRKLMTTVQEWGAQYIPHRPHDTEAAIKDLQFAYDRIVGIPNEAEMGAFPQFLRRMRQYMVTRLMGQVGIAQLGETAQPVATLGLKAFMSHSPALRRTLTPEGLSQLDSAFFREIEAMGIGVERLHGVHMQSLDEVGGLPFQVTRSGTAMKRVDDALNVATRATYEASGMSIIQQQQERAVAAAILQKVADIGQKLRDGGQLSGSELRRFAQLGLDEKMARRIADQMGRHTETSDGLMFGGTINRLNVNRWTDLEARTALEQATFKFTRKLIQSGDIGSTATWMSDPIMKTLFQFRDYTFRAYANQLLYGLHMRDMAAVNAFTWSVAWNALVRAGQIHMIAAGRSDRDRYLQKHLDPWELAKAGFQRAGWSSVAPMVIDTGLLFSGQEQMFQARSSGQASDIVFGSPVTSFYSSAGKGIGAAVRSATGSAGGPMSQSEARALHGLTPFSNMLPWSTLFSYMISDLPERSTHEKKQR